MTSTLLAQATEIAAVPQPMLAKLWFLIPEVMLFAAVVGVAVLGLSHNRRMRDLLPALVGVFLLLACFITPGLYTEDRIVDAKLMLPYLGQFMKIGICAIGVLLVMVTVGLVDRRMEAAVEGGRLAFDSLRANRGEFYAFFLLSIIGVMLCCNANDLIWLFLALELTSLPTYVMVAMSRSSRLAQEAAVKYFFLGALAAAMFLFGFALLYGATGTIVLTEMREEFARQAASDEGINVVGIVGMILALLGVFYKIAAAPMHFYAADVYEGAAAPVTAFLGFVPKVAGMLAIILLLSTLGWDGSATAPGLPREVAATLWMVAVLTMTLGNIGALLQRSVKRILAYSSIAHSGYMLIGILAGPGLGINAVLFYLVAYGVMNTAAFAVLSGLERRGNEIDDIDDLAGLRARHPAMAAVLAIAAGSLLGVPPLLGFWGKLYIFIAGVQAGHVGLVVIAGLNSAISAWYYLRLVAVPVLQKPVAASETIVRSPSHWPRTAGILMAVMVVVGPLFVQRLFTATEKATGPVKLRPPYELSQQDEEAAPIEGNRIAVRD